MKKVLSLMLVFILAFGMTTSSFASSLSEIKGSKTEDYNGIKTEILTDNQDVRVVKSYSVDEVSIATYDKRNKTIAVTTTNSLEGKTTTDKIENVNEIRSEDIRKAEKLNGLLKNDSLMLKSLNLGRSSKRTQFGDYSYHNIYSFAKIKAGKKRSLMQINSNDFLDDKVDGYYDKFCDSVDDVRECELVGEAALGAETLGLVAALALSPESAATKIAAICGAIGIAGTIVVTLISWQFKAATARKYYDKIEAKI